MIPPDPGFYKDILDQMSDGVFFVNRELKILFWSKGAQRLTGYKTEEVVGRNCNDDILCHIDYQGKRVGGEACPVVECLADGRPREMKVYLQHKRGRRVPVSVRVQPIRNAAGTITGAIEIFSDDSAATDSLRRIAAMRRLAFLDHLTQLPNRRFMEMALVTALTEYRMHKDPFGVLMIDLDHFKKINDMHGHRGGDRVLKEAARMLGASLRPDDLIGRWGGDEFIAIIRGVTPESVSDMAKRCAEFAAQTVISLGIGKQVSLTVSVGGALAQLEDTVDDLVHRADQLMYREKERSRDHSAA